MNHKEKDLFLLIGRHGVLIGSRAWGETHDKSDWDYALSEELTERFLGYLNDMGISWDENEGSSQNKVSTMFNERNIKFILAGEIVNILTYKEEHLCKIRDMNSYIESLKHLPIGRDLAKHRDIRIHVVQGYLKYAFGAYEKAQPIPEVRDDIENLGVFTEEGAY